MSKTLPAHRLKIERAKRHLSEMQHIVREFLAGEPYEIFAEDDPATGQRHAKVRVKREIPTESSAVLGDIVHNARTALDLVMVAVVRYCDPGRASYNHVYFPIGDSKESFEAALSKKTKGASAAARLIIEGLKPYKGGDEAFYRLHQLDILDKHRALIPVGTAHRNVGVTMDFGKMFPEQFAGKNPSSFTYFLRPADRQFPLKHGAILYSAPLGDQPSIFDDEIKFTFEVAFGEGQILQGEPLDPALPQIIEFVSGVCDILENKILSK